MFTVRSLLCVAVLSCVVNFVPPAMAAEASERPASFADLVEK